ncbi:hypothetical protein OBBRIDRAFT_800382 [Obba rivulosa]|uniref:FMR1-interacting protein 1 conserved domain-containing protein n=1 Tax=Obba rivulosa TaxID=1052685 RepID=A0A8E2J6N2_9APHY|nr:hypothetical protein OBBRIDRAFT_800382 [Obba rivulosa]
MHPHQFTPAGLSQYNGGAGTSRQHTVPAQGFLTANTVAAALANPYAQQFQYTPANHYAQAYAQMHPHQYGSGVTAEGYTLSSTYVPGVPGQQTTPQSGAYTQTGPQRGAPRRAPQGQAQPYWYQPGDIRCQKPGCAFTGSKKAVETHMMDRHLIYPRGWGNRKRKQDWDADPSLKGKPIPIQGTSIKLDSPEALEAWIAERKKRFPTATRVEEKEKKLGEAIARGQLGLEDSRFPRNKRRKLDHDANQESGGSGRNERGRGRGRGYGSRGRGGHHTQGGRVQDSSEPTEDQVAASLRGEDLSSRIPHPLPPLPPPSLPARPTQPAREAGFDASSGSDSDSDSAPEVASSKASMPLVELEAVGTEAGAEQNRITELIAAPPPSQHIQPPKKPTPRQPKRPPPNPFASRPSLLRNVSPISAICEGRSD